MTRLALACLLSVLLISTNASAASNLLLNEGFETMGSEYTKALNWEWGNPDYHGSTWGNASRESWRSHSGSFEGVVAGQWKGDTVGGWWQEKPAEPGVTYTMTAWFWADSSWTNQSDQGIKIEFFSGAALGETLISSVFTNFQGIGESWVQYSISAVAPANATWVRAVIWAQGVGWDGALQFDDVSLVAEPGSVILISGLPLVMAGLLATPIITRMRRKTNHHQNP